MPKLAIEPTERIVALERQNPIIRCDPAANGEATHDSQI